MRSPNFVGTGGLFFGHFPRHPLITRSFIMLKNWMNINEKVRLWIKQPFTLFTMMLLFHNRSSSCLIIIPPTVGFEHVTTPSNAVLIESRGAAAGGVGGAHTPAADARCGGDGPGGWQLGATGSGWGLVSPAGLPRHSGEEFAASQLRIRYGLEPTFFRAFCRHPGQARRRPPTGLSSLT